MNWRQLTLHITVALTALLLCADQYTDTPPLLISNSGNPVTASAQWENQRRPEILELFRNNVFGRNPVDRPATLTFEPANSDKTMVEGKATRRMVNVKYSGPGGEGSIAVTAFIPKSDQPVPAFLLICNRNPAENLDPERIKKSPFWPVEEIVERGYAAIAFFNGDVDPDNHDGFKNGAHGIFQPDPSVRTPDSWGTLAAWAWGASRVMDWIVEQPEIDSHRVAVVGHSRGGKTSLWCGANDTRFSLTISNNSGCSGAKLNRMDLPGSESIARINSSFPHWFCTNYKAYGADESTLPVDQHMLIALMAPRLAYVASATGDIWAGPPGEFASCVLASPVWQLYGQSGMTDNTFPPPDTPLQNGKVGYHLRTGEHNLKLYDWERYMDFADQHMLGNTQGVTLNYTNILDLEGSNIAIASLDGFDLITNSAPASAELILTIPPTLDEVCNAPIGGNLKLVLNGSGTLTLNAGNTFSDGIKLTAGELCFASEATLGSGEIEMAGGTLIYTGHTSFTTARTYRFTSDSEIRVANNGVEMKCAVSRVPGLKTHNFTKSGNGRLFFTSAFGEFTTEQTWTVAAGSLWFEANDSFGANSGTSDLLLLDVKEGAELVTGYNNMHIGRIQLQGATYKGMFKGSAPGNWGSITFKGKVTVLPSGTPSVITLRGGAQLGHNTRSYQMETPGGSGNLYNSITDTTIPLECGTEFFVSDGATLVIDGFIQGAFLNGTLRNSTLKKTGNGTLVLTQKSYYKGSTDIQAGEIMVSTTDALGSEDTVTLLNSNTKLAFDLHGTPDMHSPATILSPLTLNGNATISSTGYPLSLSSNISGTGNLTKEGPGLLAIPSSVTWPSALNLSEGGIVMPIYSDFSTRNISISPNTSIGFSDLSTSWQTALSDYPDLAGLVAANTTTLANMHLSPARDSLTLCAMPGKEFNIASLSGVANLHIAGYGAVNISTLGSDNQSVTLGRGAVATLPASANITAQASNTQLYLDSTLATLNLDLATNDGYIYIPDSKTLTITGTQPSSHNLYLAGNGKAIINADSNTKLFNTLYLNNMELDLSDFSIIGNGGINLTSATISYTGSSETPPCPIIFNGSANTLSIPPDTTLSFTPTSLNTSGADLNIIGGGTMKLDGTFNNTVFNSNSTWTFDNTTLEVADNSFGQWDNPVTKLKITLNPNSTLYGPEVTNTALGPLTLAGGTIQGAPYYIDSYTFGSLRTVQFRGFSFPNQVEVLPSDPPSHITGHHAMLSHNTRETIFNIVEGAELLVTAMLSDGLDENSAPRASALVKTGSGKLKLAAQNNFTGGTQLLEGTLQISHNLALGGSVAQYIAAPGTTLELDDNITLSTSGTPLFASAGVWVDAMDSSTITCDVDGTTLISVANKGSAGGKFVAVTQPNGSTPPPATGTLAQQGINNHPALHFNGAEALLLNTYTNQSSGMTIFALMQRTENITTFHGAFSLSRMASSADDNQTYGAFTQMDHTGPKRCGAHFCDPRGARYVTMSRPDTESFILTVNQEGIEFNAACTYADATSDVESGTLNTLYDNNTDLVMLGGRLRGKGVAQYYGSYTGNSRMWRGKIGELIIFPRSLTPAEENYIATYLHEKWFGAGVVPTANNENHIKVDASSSATINASIHTHNTSKTGTGNLVLAAPTTPGSTLTLAEGQLSLVSQILATKADIWVDADDASTLTIDEGELVTTVLNKGRAGGTFAQNPNGTTPLYPAYNTASDNGFNGRGTLQFNGEQALLLPEGHFSNKSQKQLTIFLVGKRLSYVNNGPGGKWGGLFSMSYKAAPNLDDLVNGTFYQNDVEEHAVNLSAISGVAGFPDTIRINNRLQTQVPFIIFAEFTPAGRRGSIENLGDTITTATRGTTLPSVYGPFNIDLVQIGGRLRAAGAAQYHGSGNGSNRMYHGLMCEFLVFNEPLAEAEIEAIAHYLRGKWMEKPDRAGMITTTPPAFLADAQLTTASLPANGTFAQSSNTTLSFATATQSIGNLAVDESAVWQHAVPEGAIEPIWPLFVTAEAWLPTTLTYFVPALLPDTSPLPLVESANDINGTTLWTLAGDRPQRYKVRQHPNSVELVKNSGTLINIK